MTMTEILPCELTRAEVADRADEASRLAYERESTDRKRKLDASLAAAKVKALDEQIGRLLEEVRTQKTLRSVEVYEEVYYALGEARTMRKDTGEVVARRPLRPDELQIEIPLAKTTKKRSKKNEQVDEVDAENESEGVL